ncbi:MAG: cytidylate kinase-like family protein [Ruminococcaceae bacterium]|nr:cytidylate kinase-like family protein [Oscillospiraceae bacterium]
MANLVITIARGFGSGGRTIGKLLAQRLDIDYYDNDLIKLASEESGINIELFGRADEKVKVGLFKRYNRSYGEYVLSPDSDEFVSDGNLFNYQAKIIRDLAEKKDCIIVGRCGDYILRNNPNVIRLFIYADDATNVKNVVDLYGIRPSEAKKTIEKIDKSRAEYYKYYTGKEWSDVSNYDLCINTSGISFEKAADVIISYIETIRK